MKYEKIMKTSENIKKCKLLEIFFIMYQLFGKKLLIKLLFYLLNMLFTIQTINTTMHVYNYFRLFLNKEEIKIENLNLIFRYFYYTAINNKNCKCSFKVLNRYVKYVFHFSILYKLLI